MPKSAIAISDRVISALPLATNGQYKVRDLELRGFGVLVGKRAKTFLVEGEYWNDGKRQFRVTRKIAPTDEMTSRDARFHAREILLEISKGIRPDEPEPVEAVEEKPVTLREAWERYLGSHLIRKGRSAGTIASYTDHVERLFSDWLDLPLHDLVAKPRMVPERHDLLSNENCQWSHAHAPDHL